MLRYNYDQATFLQHWLVIAFSSLSKNSDFSNGLPT